MSCGKGSVRFSFDGTNPDAVIWARTRSAELVKDISLESRQAIRSVIARSFEEGIPPKDAAKLIRYSVSLTEQQANAVVNLHQKILTSPGNRVVAGKTIIRVPEAGMDTARLDRVLKTYAEQLTKQRALTIARTETIRASNEGQLQLWKQAQKAGQLATNVRRVWLAAPSERTCPQCMSLDGQERKLDEAWDGISNPPAHPRCRCSTGLVG